MMHSEVNVLLRFLLAIFVQLRLCRGDLPAFGSPPGGSFSDPFPGGAVESVLVVGDNNEDGGPPPPPSDPSLVLSVVCTVVSGWAFLSPRLRWWPRWNER